MLFNYKTKRTVSELFFRLKYSCVNSELLYFYLISVFLHTVLYFIKKWFIVTNFTLPRLFRNPAISNFFHFPWDFEIAGFNCISCSSHRICQCVLSIYDVKEPVDILNHSQEIRGIKNTISTIPSILPLILQCCLFQ